MEETNLTQPEVEGVETETTITDTTAETDTSVNAVSDDEVQQNTTETETADGVQEGSVNDEFYLQVKYNKKTQSLNRDDAVRYAQMGLKLESMQPTLKKLQYIAVAGGQSLEGLVDDIVSGIENSKLEKFKAKADGDEEILNALVAEDKRKAGKAYDEWQEAERKAEEQDRQDEIKTLADEFYTLQKEIPKFSEKKFESVPEEVLRIREKNNISLYDAYLRYRHSNLLSAQKEKKKQEDNAFHSTGEITNGGADDKPNWESELLRGIWG